MKIKITKPCEIEIVESCDNEDNVESTIETLNVGEILDVDVFGFQSGRGGSLMKNHPQFQFPDGSITFSLCRDLFDFPTVKDRQEYNDEYNSMCEVE